MSMSRKLIFGLYVAGAIVAFLLELFFPVFKHSIERVEFYAYENISNGNIFYPFFVAAFISFSIFLARLLEFIKQINAGNWSAVASGSNFLSYLLEVVIFIFLAFVSLKGFVGWVGDEFSPYDFFVSYLISCMLTNILMYFATLLLMMLLSLKKER